MTVINKFKKSGDKTVESFRPKSGLILNIKDANERIQDLESQLATTEVKQRFLDKNTPLSQEGVPEGYERVVCTNVHSKSYGQPVVVMKSDPNWRDKRQAEINAKILAEKKSVEDRHKALMERAKRPEYREKISVLTDYESDEILLAKMRVLDAEEALRVERQALYRPSLAEIEKYSFDTEKREFKGEVFYSARHGYHLAFEVRGTLYRAYIKKDRHAGEPFVNEFFDVLLQRTDDLPGNPNVKLGSMPGKERDLTKEMFVAILASHPSYEEICKVYRLKAQTVVSIQTRDVVALW